MKRILGVFVLLAILSGCASNQKYGDFTVKSTDAVTQHIMLDGANHLAATYPVAHTVFKIDQRTSESETGALFEEALRDSGFAVSFTEGKTLNFWYDNFGDYKVTKKFRLTLMVDDVKMSRLYTDKGTYGIDNTSWTIVE